MRSDETVTKQDAIMEAAKAYAVMAQLVAEQIEFVRTAEREHRSAECSLSNMRSELVKLKAALDAAVEAAGKP